MKTKNPARELIEQLSSVVPQSNPNKYTWHPNDVTIHRAGSSSDGEGPKTPGTSSTGAPNTSSAPSTAPHPPKPVTFGNSSSSSAFHPTKPVTFGSNNNSGVPHPPKPVTFGHSNSSSMAPKQPPAVKFRETYVDHDNHAELNNHHLLSSEAKKHLNSLKGDDKENATVALKNYNFSSGDVAARMRRGEFPDDKDVDHTVEHLRKLTNKPVGHAARVYRGMREFGKDLKPGDTFDDKAFVSTSLDPSVAESFSDNGLGKHRTHVMIDVQKHHKGHYISAHEGENDLDFSTIGEKELVLHPSTFKVLGKVKVDHGYSDEQPHEYLHVGIHSQED